MQTHLKEGLIPDKTQIAARRALIRTSAQSLSSALAIGTVTVFLDTDWWLKALIFVAGVVVTAALAGLSAYFNVLSNGIPEDYQPNEVETSES